MTQSWGSHPQFKVETEGTEFKEVSTIQVTRPENNVSFAVITVNDYKSKSFEGVFDALNSLEISFRYKDKTDTWTKVFKGTIETVKPHLSVERGEILEVAAWGLGQALIDTHCNTSYGKEGKKQTTDTPREIWVDIILSYVNKSFEGDNTGYYIDHIPISNIHPELSITNITSPYFDNFTLINRVCDLVNAHVGTGSASCHWFVDPTHKLYMDTIGNHEHNASGWPTYWGGSEAASTIEVAKDMIVYDFRKNVSEYANKILLCSDLRKPGWDSWTEGRASEWGYFSGNGLGVHNITDEASVKIVGDHSIRLEAKGIYHFRWPGSGSAAWEFDNIGSKNKSPFINFYVRRNAAFALIRFCLHTDNTNYFYRTITSDIADANKWYQFSFPVGKWWRNWLDKTEFLWSTYLNPSWDNINFLSFELSQINDNKYVYVDDLHFSGKIIREAYDSTAISNNNEYQKVIRNDMALDDSMKASDDSGTAARLAYAELLRRKQTPIVGMIQIPGAVDILPGQLVRIHACKKSDGDFRINKDFRIKELKHIFAKSPTGFRTILNLTDDLKNSHAFGVPTAHSLLMKYAGALGHAEARDLKGSGIDIEIPRLSKNYA